MEEIAASTSNVLLMKDGSILASGPSTRLTSENLSALYGLPVQLEQVRGRWFALCI